jgi:type I restriction enzyme S subunit
LFILILAFYAIYNTRFSWTFFDVQHFWAFINDEQADKLSNVIVEKEDVLLNITGASIARSCVAPSKYLPARVNQHVTIIRPNTAKISSYFLNYLITSRPYKEKLLFTGDKAGATRQALTKAQVEDFLIHFPSLDEQEIIVKKLNLLEIETQKLETIYRQKIAALHELKQSILQKAFTGQLTSKNC